MTTVSSRVIVALLLVAALAGAVREGGQCLKQVGQWRKGPTDVRERLQFGSYREVFSFSGSRVSPKASVLLLSDWDPALLPYYLYPRKIFQLDVDPETNQDFMKLPPSPYPRRRPESFAVDWVIRLRNVGGALTPEFLETGRP